MVSIESPVTADQLLSASGLGRCELVRGELIAMPPAGEEHGDVAMNVGALLQVYVKQRRLGKVYAAETGFKIESDPDTVRAPDVAFVRADRLGPRPSKKFFRGPPDLAVEVLSPDDRMGEMLAKIHQWLDSGCRAVWLVDPETRTVTVYRSQSQIVTLGISDTLTGEDVVPGFAMPVADVFG